MSLADKLRNQKRKIHSTFKIEFPNGEVEVVDVAEALVSDRQSVFAQTKNAGELELFARVSKAEGEFNVDDVISYQRVSARIICRLLHKDNARVFSDTQLDEALSIPGFDTLAEQAWKAFAGEPMGKPDGKAQEEKSDE